MSTTANEVHLSPREKAPQGTRVTSWWIDGSRDRYGQVYFLTKQTAFLRDGSQDESWTVWQNHRPYGTNQTVGTISAQEPLTWAALDAVIR